MKRRLEEHEVETIRVALLRSLERSQQYAEMMESAIQRGGNAMISVAAAEKMRDEHLRMGGAAKKLVRMFSQPSLEVEVSRD